MKGRLKRFFCIASSFLMMLSSSTSVFAADATADEECASAGIRYYECVRKECNTHDCDPGKTDSIALIGDSISNDGTVRNLLKTAFPTLTDAYYDAVPSRPWNDGLDILRNKMLSRDIIVYQLGSNNGTLTEDNIKEVMDIVGNSKTVIFVTNYADPNNVSRYPQYTDHNDLFHAAASTYNNVRVADWYRVATDNNLYLDSMGVHANGANAQYFADVIIEAINKGSCHTGAVELLGNTAEEKMWSGLLSIGFTKEQAAGVMGSMKGESGFNPARHETKLYKAYNGGFQLDGNPSISYGLGLIQWSFSRRINMYNYVKDKAPDLLKYLDNPKEYGTISGDEFLAKAGSEGEELIAFELMFMSDEFSNSAQYSGIYSQTTVSAASEYFVRRIEIPGNIEQAVRDRDGYSHDYYNRFKDRSDLEPSSGVKTIAKADGFRLADYQIKGTNQDYAGNPIFTDDQLAKIIEYKPFYEQAVAGTQIPWEMPAVIHVRESGLSRKNPNSDGLFQFYGTGRYEAGADVDDDEFVEQLTEMVNTHLVPKWSDQLSGDDQIKNIFFGYNGRAGVYIQQARDLGFTEEQAKVGEGSPYVMNRADAKRDPNVAPAGTWGQIKQDAGPIEYPANQDAGAFVMYQALAGGSSDSGCGNTNTSAARKISDTAVDFAWPIGDMHNTFTPGVSSGSPEALTATAAYESAANALDNWYKPGGADCSFFVGTVILSAGVDPDFPKAGSAVQTDYLKNSDKWENLTSQNNGTDESFLRAGDVMIVPNTGNPGHVRIVVDLGNGTLGTAEASLNGHSGELHGQIGLDAGRGRGLYQVYRIKE